MNKIDLDKLKYNTIDYIQDLSQNYLKEIIDILKYHYYETDSPLVDDHIYDIIEDYYINKYTNNLSIGYNILKIDSINKIKLPIYCGSLDKIKDKKSIDDFTNKYKGNYVVTDKLDGQSLEIEYKNNDVFIYTRGDGFIGRDVSHLKNYLNIPKNVGNNNFIIRAEFEMSESNFNKLFPDAKNARNVISGVLTRKNIDLNIVKHIDVICYNILNKEFNQQQQLNILRNFGFKVPSYIIVNDINIEFLTNYYKDRKSKSNYKIDGLVISENKYYHPLTGENPKHIKAFKLSNFEQSESESAVGIVQDIIWQESKYSVLKPVIHIKPVDICGVTISKVTGFNYKYILENKIGINSELLIIRSGDVIPHIIDIIKSTEPLLPNKKFILSESGIDAILIEESDNVKIKKILNFFKVLEVDSLSIGLITKIYNKGYIDIFKIINMKIEDFLIIDGFKNTLAEKIYNNIKVSLNNITLEKLVIASGCFGKDFGKKRIQSILSKIDITKTDYSFDELYYIIINIDGFSENLTNRFIDNFYKFSEFYLEINKYITINNKEKDKQINNLSNKLKGLNVLFTGFRDNELKKYIIENGGVYIDTLSSKINLLIVTNKEYNNKKVKLANQKNIKILTKEEFINEQNI